MRKAFEQTLSELLPGKRLRPLLTLTVLETFGQPIEKGLYPAAAIEMVHSFSLIHDDLPCMDDDDLRRGKPTLHKIYPESHAVLTGDFLLTYAFEILAKAPGLTDHEKNALISTRAIRGGSKGMLGGQILDLEGNPEDWEIMSLKKTGALISAALEFGAILVGEALLPFQEVGKHLGLAFQLTDDLLDGDGAVKIFGPEIAKEKASHLLKKAHEIIKSFPLGAPKLQALATDMVQRTV
jgi:geranylgeranyl diphosphate synthase type II